MENTTEVSQSSWKFSKTFWTANFVELLERGAYYGMFIVITLFLSQVVGFSDVEAGIVSGIFSGGLYLLPTFAGAYADKIGFKKALVIAFATLTIGYFLFAAFPTKLPVMAGILCIMIGGATIKSVITATVAKETNKQNRARAFSIFYAMVNVGSFLGKTAVYPIRLQLGLIYVNYFSAGLTLIALILILLFFKSYTEKNETKSAGEIWAGLVRILTNKRLLILVLISTGFWITQFQLYASMPKYVIRMVGEHASPEWIANVNPLIVVFTVMLLTQLLRNVKAITSMAFGMFVIPIAAIAMSLGPWLSSELGNQISILGLFTLHPISLMLIVGIILQAIAESLISPRYLEFFSLQAPAGQEGMYLGFSNIHMFFAAVSGFFISGYLLDKFCPDPNKLQKLYESGLISMEQMNHAYDNAHHLWYVFAVIGVIAAVALVFYGIITERIDKKQQQTIIDAVEE